MGSRKWAPAAKKATRSSATPPHGRRPVAHPMRRSLVHWRHPRRVLWYSVRAFGPTLTARRNEFLEAALQRIG